MFRAAGQNLIVKIPGSQQITRDENSSMPCGTQLGHEVRQGPPVPTKMTDVDGSAKNFREKKPCLVNIAQGLVMAGA